MDYYVYCIGFDADMQPPYAKCKELGLSTTVLRRHLNDVVPSPTVGGYGGFRELNKDITCKRMNTTGWSLLRSSDQEK